VESEYGGKKGVKGLQGGGYNRVSIKTGVVGWGGD